MNNRFVTGHLAVMLMGFVLSGVPIWGAVPDAAPIPAADQASAVTEIDAQVVSVDLEKHQLTVKDSHDQVVTLLITRDTTISSPGNSKLVLKNVKINDKLHAYYTTADRKARQIDVAPGLPVIHDLENH